MMLLRASMLCLFSCQSGATEQLKFAVYDPGFPPYIFVDEQQNVSGILADLMADYALEYGIAIDYVLDNRQGGESRLYAGQVDTMVLSPAWTKHPEQLLFSEEILPYTDYLFRLDKGNDILHWRAGQSVCTRQYYVYPTLNELFATASLLRVDASSEEAQLRMLASGRCDFAYVNELIAYWLVQEHFPDLQIAPVEQHKAVDSLRLALSPNKADMLPGLNQYIASKKQNGALRKVVRTYVGTLPEQR
ncbi:substrate-binding periplasmic protein [Bowmanella denitrificans]